jgi:hypothetical protein
MREQGPDSQRMLPSEVSPGAYRVEVILLDLNAQRVAYRRCDTIRQVEPGFADSCFSYTRTFERYVLELSKHMTIFDVARHLHISWDVIQKRYLKKRFSRPVSEGCHIYCRR